MLCRPGSRDNMTDRGHERPDRPATGSDDRHFGFRTRSVHAGGRPDPTTGARAVPIYQTTSFVFRDTAEAANLFALQTFGSIYSRIANPTVAAFEERMASLEGGIGAIGTASGQAAEFLTMASLAGAGDHLVASAQLYGGTRTLFDVTLRRFGVETTFVERPEPDDIAAAITPQTKAIYTEVIANPSGMVADLAGLADVAHANGVPLVVDSTTATPYLCRPIEHGADIVLHSVTKFVGGHGTSIGGAVVESGRFPWDNGRFPLMTEPIASYGGISWWGNFGEYGFLTRLRSEQLRDIGATMTPFNAFLFLHGLRDARPADAPARRERGRRRRVPRRSRMRRLGVVRRPPGLAVVRPGEAVPARRRRRGVRVRRQGRARGRRQVHRVVPAGQPPRQHR